MTRRVYLYFVVTIFLGAVLGGVGSYYFMWYTGRLQHTPSSRKERVARLTKVLSLSDAQAQQVDQIFEESSRKVSELQKQIDPQFQAIHMETRSRIRQILDPDQQKKFDEFLRGIDARRRRRGLPPPPPR